MTRLIVRALLWVAGVGLAAVALAAAVTRLDRLSNSQQSLARDYLRSKLGETTAAQDRLIDRAVREDPIVSMLIVADCQRRNVPPWDHLSPKSLRYPSDSLELQSQAMALALDGKLTKEDAVGYVDSALPVWQILNEVDPQEAVGFLNRSRHLSPEECRVAVDNGAFAFALEKLKPEQRAIYRDYEKLLSPVFANTAPEQWPEVVAVFEKARPEVVDIYRDPKLGPMYAITYMFNLDLVKQLQTADIPVKSAIELVAINGSQIAQLRKQHTNWAADISRLHRLHGPDGKRSLLTIACQDPALIWLIAHDESENQQAAFAVLERYAGTELPAILTKYGDSPKLLSAAMDSLIRFDNLSDPDPKKRGAAAQFLSHYQDDPAFKELLEKHGAVLIPAMSAGGPNALAQISKNPSDIRKWVDAAGKPRGTPLWTYLPGGSLVYAVNEKAHGRSLSWGEIGWAAFDTGTLVFVAAKAVRIAAAAGEVADKTVLQATAEAVEKDAVELVVKEAGETAGAEVIQVSGRAGLVATTGNILKAAGVKTVQGLNIAAKALGRVIAQHPLKSLLVSGAILAAAFPDTIGQAIRNFASATGKNAGAMMMGVPGNIVGGMYDELQRLLKERPGMGWLYWPLFVAVWALFFAAVFVLLRWLLRPVYATIVQPLKGIATRLTRSLWPRHRETVS